MPIHTVSIGAVSIRTQIAPPGGGARAPPLYAPTGAPGGARTDWNPRRAGACAHLTAPPPRGGAQLYYPLGAVTNTKLM